MSGNRLKRLRFAYHPADDESVIGAFAAACHEQRLRSLVSGIEGAGVSLTRPGSLAMADEATLGKVAAAMRTKPSALIRLACGREERGDRISLGDLSLPRMVMDLERRRIAPLSIRNDPRHKSAWLNLLLPYCPLSLELLVDACPTCGPLGWRRTRGIGACETCGIDVPPSDAPPLAAADASAYRLAASLLSRDARTGATAVETLPTQLHDLSRTTLVAVLVRAGTVLGSDRLERPLDRLLSAEPATIARAICSGARLLLGWPNAIQDAASRRTAMMGDDLVAYKRLRADLKWISRGSAEVRGRESHDLIRAAFPTLDGRTAAPFARATRYYTATETSKRLWTASSELDLLRDAGAIAYERLPSNKRIRARYDAGDVDALAESLGASESPGSAASRLDLPVYALGQLTPWLRVHDERGVVILRGPQVGTSSIDDLLDLLAKNKRHGRPPKGFVTLEAALSRFPGEKPWSHMVQAMTAGDLPFHLPAGRSGIRACLVEPAAVVAITAGTPPAMTDVFATDYLSLRDAFDVLVAGREEALATIALKRIDIVNRRRGKAVDRGNIARLVADVAFPSEVAAATGRNAIKLYHELVGLKVPRVGGAWSRAELVARGIVRPYELPMEMRSLTPAVGCPA